MGELPWSPRRDGDEGIGATLQRKRLDPIVVAIDTVATSHIDLARDGVTQTLPRVLLPPLAEAMAGLVFVT